MLKFNVNREESETNCNFTFLVDPSATQSLNPFQIKFACLAARAIFVCLFLYQNLYSGDPNTGNIKKHFEGQTSNGWSLGT